MHDTSETNSKMIEEMSALRHRIMELEESDSELKQTRAALKDSEERYKTLFNNDRTAICISDIETKGFINVNKTLVRLYGYSREELLNGMNVLDLSAQQDESFDSVGQTSESPHTFVSLRWHRKKDGTIFPVEIIAWPYQLKDRKVIFAMVFDISERFAAEEILKQTHQNYDAFFNTIDDFLFVLDGQGNIIHVNSTVINRLGYTREEIVGKSVLMVHPPERIDEVKKIIDEMLSGKIEYCPVPIMTKSGVQIPVETRVSYGHWNCKPALFGVTKDISKIKLSEEKFFKLFHLNPSACGLSDLDTFQYIELNDAFYTLFGYSKEEVIGKTPMELGIITPETRNSILLKSNEDGKVIKVEADLKTKSGEIKHVLMSAENIYIQDKKYRFTFAYDITERRRTEEFLKTYRDHLEEKIRERTSELEAKSIALQESNTALKVLLKQREDDKKELEERFVMNLRTLVLPYIEEMKKGHFDARQQFFLDIIESHLKEIASPLLKNMQQFNLTPRETKIATLIRQDRSTKEIAEILRISSGSIDVHRKNIRKKLGLSKRKTNLSSYLKNLDEWVK